MKVESQDGSHIHRHVRIASKVLASANVDSVHSEFALDEGMDSSHIVANLKFYTKIGREVGSIKTDVSVITQLYDNSFDHESRLKMEYGKEISPIYS